MLMIGMPAACASVDDLVQAARVGAAGDDAVGPGGDRRADGLLLRGTSPLWNEVLTVLPVSVGPWSAPGRK